MLSNGHECGQAAGAINLDNQQQSIYTIPKHYYKVEPNDMSWTVDTGASQL